MAGKTSLRTISALCLLGWLFIFGLFSGADQGVTSTPRILVLAGVVCGASPDGLFEIDDGAHRWPCRIGEGVRLPAPGECVVAYCTVGPDGRITALGIGAPRPENLF